MLTLLTTFNKCTIAIYWGLLKNSTGMVEFFKRPWIRFYLIPVGNKIVPLTVILAIKVVTKILAGIIFYKLKYYNLMWTFPGCRSFADPTQRHINQYRKYHNLELTCENVWLTFQAHLGQSISEVSYNVLRPLYCIKNRILKNYFIKRTRVNSFNQPPCM